MPEIWVDIVTGTWGAIEDLRVIEYDDIETIENLTENQLVSLAMESGREVIDAS